MDFKKRLRKHFKEVLKTKTSAHSIAMGAAIGTLIGTLPIPFLDFFIAFAVLLMFKKISKYVLLASVVFWNPFTKIPIYTFSYTLGDFLYRDVKVITLELSFWDNIYVYSRRFLVGNLIISAVLTLLTYFLVFAIVKYLKRTRKKCSPTKRKINPLS